TSNDYTDHDYYVDVYTSYTEATNFYRNKNNIEFKYLMGVELYNSDSSHFDMNLCPEIAEERSDVISIISIWDETDYLDSYDDMTTVLLNEFGIKNNPEYLAVNNTYTIVYDNMKLIYSEFLEKYIWVPVIGDIAGIYTLEDLKNPFNSCAGFKTNPIQNYSKMLYISFTDDDLDSLCYHSINHIERNESNDEYYLYDILMYIDEDLLTKRLNIRRTLNDFKQKLRIFLKNFMFEPNTVNNREIISTQINMIISDMISRDGVIDGYCVCDDSNNTPDIINMNELHIGIVLQPTQVIRQISIEINIEKGTIGFTENEIA
ncbi:MAG: hypothetical protein M0R03_22620, partial [Novosphingobium sp.]|nr:hypothetical protein [Novosphingobium sp.]